jgi:hydrogenase nickel incorporation protein HypA/HybF
LREPDIVNALFDQVDRHVAQHAGASVAVVRVKVGALADVDAGILGNIFNVLRVPRGHAQATLHVVSTPAEWLCQNCSAESVIPDEETLSCPACGGRVDVAEGDAVVILDIALALP